MALALVAVAITAAVACDGRGSDAPYAPNSGGGAIPRGTSNSLPGEDGSAGSDSTGGGSGTSSDYEAVDVSRVSAFDSGFDTARQLGSLTPGEVEMLCEHAKSYFVGHVSLADWERAYCYDVEGRHAETQGECSIRVDGCLVDTIFDYLPCSLEPLKTGASCGKTVGLYANCMRESVAIAMAEVDFFDCAHLDSSARPQQLDAVPVACEELYRGCPSLD